MSQGLASQSVKRHRDTPVFWVAFSDSSCDWYIVDAAIDLRRHAHSAVGNSFGPNNICCILRRIACNSSLRSFFPGRVKSAQIGKYIRSADSPLAKQIIDWQNARYPV